MTDKQIIIDGVDVSGCNFTLERDGKIKCECCHATGFGVICDCESWKTCDYKNYKRKEQECERLNKEIHNLNSTINFIKVTEHSAINNYNKLKQALIEIKEIANNTYLKYHTKTEYDAVIRLILQKCEVLDV